MRYQNAKAIFGIDPVILIEGDLPNKQKKLVEAWMEIHKDELLANWDLAVSGETPYKIEPLK